MKISIVKATADGRCSAQKGMKSLSLRRHNDYFII